MAEKTAGEVVFSGTGEVFSLGLLTVVMWDEG